MIEDKLKLYNNTYVKGEVRSKEYNKQLKQKEAVKNAEIILLSKKSNNYKRYTMQTPIINQFTINNQTMQNNNATTNMFDKPFYTNKDVMKMLDCTEKTLRKYRNDGFIGYSRIGDKFYYTVEDIVLFLNRTHIDPYQFS